MGVRKRSDERGIAALAIIGIIVLVVAVAGVGYMVLVKNNDKKTTTQSAEVVAANAEAEKACKALYDDKDLCKFASNYDPNGASYKATFTSTTDGKTSTFVIEADKSGNSSTVTKEGETETGAYISLNGDTYIKDPADGSWTKYPKSPDTPTESKPTDDIAVDFKDEETKAPEKRITYKKIGKEACGNDTCFKYQIIDPEQPGVESFIWFDDNDYVMRKYSTKEANGNYSEGTFEYTSVTITAPSPVKEAPAAPSAADIQQQIQQAQEAAGSQ